MGGGGGGFISSEGPSPEEIREKIQKSQDEEKVNKFEREIQTLLDRKLVQFNDRDTEQINHHIEAIKKALEKDIDGTVDLCFGGSVDKHTYVDGLSDIDSLVILNESGLEDLKPSEVKDYFAKRLQERFPETTISKGNMAVTVQFQNHEIQLLPVVKKGSNLLISGSDGKSWSSIRPDKFADALTKTNKSCGSKLVPTIKLVKAIINNLPQIKQLSGYHTEALAVSIFSQYKGGNTSREMLKHFFAEASKQLKSPKKDTTGQSIYVDSYLGETGSLQRKIVADSLSRIHRKVSNADSSFNINVWENIFGEI